MGDERARVVFRVNELVTFQTDGDGGRDATRRGNWNER